MACEVGSTRRQQHNKADVEHDTPTDHHLHLHVKWEPYRTINKKDVQQSNDRLHQTYQ